jgi:predicted dehydrogenase
MQNNIRILLSGPGLIGQKHVDLIEQGTRTGLVAIVAPDHPQNVVYARARGVPLYNSLLDALDSEPVDAVIISSPNSFHYDQAILCIERGLPVLVEKPLADSLAHAAGIAEKADEHGVPVLVGHHRTYSPLLRVAREFLSSDQFGQAVTVQGSAQFFKPDDYFIAGPWRTRLGGGPIMINLIHEIGVMRFLCGEIDKVTATISRAIRRFEVEDSMAVVFSFRNGAVGTFILSDVSASSKSWEMTAGENPAYPHFPLQDCYHFGGTMGSLDFPSMQYRTYFGCLTRSWWAPFAEGRLQVTPQDPLKLQLEHFADVIEGTATPLVSAQDGYLNMVVLAAIVQSAESGQAVEVSGLML